MSAVVSRAGGHAALEMDMCAHNEAGCQIKCRVTCI